ncbi:MAG TPA: cupin domain-containing protein [Rhodocyclaceae bacterium]
MKAGSLFAGVVATAPVEAFTALLDRPGVRVERIVSTGQASPPGFWYDQPEGEWVLVVAGEARLQIEGEAQPRTLKAGDWIELPAHCRHRVEWTTPAEPTVWLAIHYR